MPPRSSKCGVLLVSIIYLINILSIVRGDTFKVKKIVLKVGLKIAYISVEGNMFTFLSSLITHNIGLENILQ